MAESDMLKRVVLIAAAAALAAAAVAAISPVPGRLEKVTDHYYWSAAAGGLPPMGAVVTREGTLLIDPPADADLSWLPDESPRLNAGSVRWVVLTGPGPARAGAGRSLLKTGSTMILSEAMEDLVYPVKREELFGPPQANELLVETRFRPAGPLPRFVFGRQMRLFPDGVEVRVFALGQKARTAADVVVYLPAEKLLHVGPLFTPGTFPAIDLEEGGSAAGWIDGLKQVIDLVPILKSAMPQPKPDPAKPPPEEKTLEELVLVVPGRGPLSNLQEMKNLLDGAQRIRTEASRSAAAGRSLQTFLGWSSLAPYRQWENFEIFATLLYEAAAAK